MDRVGFINNNWFPDASTVDATDMLLQMPLSKAQKPDSLSLCRSQWIKEAATAVILVM